MNAWCWRLAGLAVLLFVAFPAVAQEAMPLPRMVGTVELDGMPDEAAWQAIDPLPLVMYQPTYEGAVEQTTEIRVAYDDDYLYVAGHLYDSEGDVRGNTLYRDRYSGDDTFAIVLDTFNDNENALWFFTTPNGVRFDMAVQGDGEGGGGGGPFGGVVNDSWNTFWDAATVRTKTGWFAEMRIPYSSLGFQDDNGRVTMGMIAYRYMARNNHRYIFPNIPPNWGLGFAKPSQAQKIVLEGVQSRKPLYLTPYALGGLGRDADLNDAETAYLTDNNRTGEVGLDLKYNVTSNLTLDVTLNTDFAQVEADDQQVNLSRFSLFFPEKRQFFQERAGIFEFTTGRRDRLFYSRRIGLEDGEAIRILGGTRLVGRVGGWDVGLINMQTARATVVDDDERVRLPSENFGVLRLRRQVLNPNSYAGGMFTSRLADDGDYNYAYGLDATLRVLENDFLLIKWAQTFEDDLIRADAFNFLETGLFRARWERRTQLGLSFVGSFTRIGDDYEPGIGFITRNGATNPAVRLGYGVFPGEDSRFRRLSVTSTASLYFRNGEALFNDRSLETLFFFTTFSASLKSGTELSLGATVEGQDLLEELEFPEDTTVPIGRYTFARAEANYRMHSGRLLRTNIGIEGGTFYDGSRVTVSVGPTWNASRYLELGGEYELNRVNFSERNQSFNAHIVRLRTQVGLNTKVSANAFLQYSSAGDFVSANVRFRYNFREGNDLWLVYNEGLNTDRRRDFPTRPLTDNRTVLLKYTYTFVQ